MYNKIGRNDPCWCGSGIKFKRCHLRRDEQPPPTVQNIVDGVREAFSSKYCLHPKKADCSGAIIKAHTVQRNGCLSKIAKGGKVYSIKANNFADIKNSNGIPNPKRISIGKASTFTGFCGRHDDSLFAPIEKLPFSGSQDHCFLLAYRALCIEVFAKRAAIEALPLLSSMDKGKPSHFQEQQRALVATARDGMKAGLKDCETIKAKYDAALVAGDHSGMNYFIVRLNETPDLMCSAALFPTNDFDGNELQALASPTATADHLTCSIIATTTGGAVVLTWLGNSLCAEKFVKSLVKQTDPQLVQSIVRFVFEFFENNYLSPDWWDALPVATQLTIKNRIKKAADTTAQRTADCLVDDGLKTVNWTVNSRQSNLVL